MKSQGKDKVNVVVKKEGNKSDHCSHYDKDGHNDEKCWKLHPELQPKWFRERSEKNMQE